LWLNVIEQCCCENQVITLREAAAISLKNFNILQWFQINIKTQNSNYIITELNLIIVNATLRAWFVALQLLQV
jgi:hypothetical protein